MPLLVLVYRFGSELMTINIEWQDQNGCWHRYQQLHNTQDAFRVATRRAQITGKRQRIMSDDGQLQDLVEPS